MNHLGRGGVDRHLDVIRLARQGFGPTVKRDAARDQPAKKLDAQEERNKLRPR